MIDGWVLAVASHERQDQPHDGHLFVVHGRIESVIHDFALVPTSSSFGVRGYWKPVVGAEPERERPVGWPGRGYARAKHREDIWFVNVGGHRSHGADTIVERALGALSEIAGGVSSRRRAALNH